LNGLVAHRASKELVIALQEYGYWGVALAIALESIGVPVPGETALVAAGLYAGKTQALNIWVLIAFASAGAILGDNFGYWIGREIGFRVLLRYGSYIGLTESRIKLGQYTVPVATFISLCAVRSAPLRCRCG
jgi:membrane protein DedA with SNARE-associated domain